MLSRAYQSSFISRLKWKPWRRLHHAHLHAVDLELVGLEGECGVARWRRKRRWTYGQESMGSSPSAKVARLPRNPRNPLHPGAVGDFHVLSVSAPRPGEGGSPDVPRATGSRGIPTFHQVLGKTPLHHPAKICTGEILD